MDNDIIVQYSGPYSIQTTNATMGVLSEKTFCITVDRDRLQEIEQPINEPCHR